MPNLSTTSTQPTPWDARRNTFVPFTAHIRITPDHATGKRWSLWRNLEKIALRVENDLIDAGLNIATPIAFTPQIGDFTARLTIVGFLERSQLSIADGGDGRSPIAPTTNIDFIHSGVDPGESTSLIDGNRGGSLSEGQDPIIDVRNEVIILLDLLNSSTDQFNLENIIHVEYNGVKYGFKKQGSRSFGS
jgi:hypothetical protein